MKEKSVDLRAATGLTPVNDVNGKLGKTRCTRLDIQAAFPKHPKASTKNGSKPKSNPFPFFAVNPLSVPQGGRQGDNQFRRWSGNGSPVAVRWHPRLSQRCAAPSVQVRCFFFFEAGFLGFWRPGIVWVGCENSLLALVANAVTDAVAKSAQVPRRFFCAGAQGTQGYHRTRAIGQYGMVTVVPVELC